MRVRVRSPTSKPVTASLKTISIWLTAAFRGSGSTSVISAVGTAWSVVPTAAASPLHWSPTVMLAKAPKLMSSEAIWAAA